MSKTVPLCTNLLVPSKKIYVYKKCFFFGQNYLKKLFSDLQKNMPKISKYILGVQCIVTKVNDSLREV